MYLVYVEVQMRQISFDHISERDFVPLEIAPAVFEFCRIDRLDYVDDVQIVIFPQSDHHIPIGMQVILQGYPQVVVLTVIREDQIFVVL